MRHHACSTSKKVICGVPARPARSIARRMIPARRYAWAICPLRHSCRQSTIRVASPSRDPAATLLATLHSTTHRRHRSTRGCRDSCSSPSGRRTPCASSPRAVARLVMTGGFRATTSWMLAFSAAARAARGRRLCACAVAGPTAEGELGSTLKGVLAFVEARNPELRAMTYEADAAQQRLRGAGALPDPVIQMELRDIPFSEPTLSPANAGNTRYPLRQMYPLGDKRELRRGIATAEASVADARARRRDRRDAHARQGGVQPVLVRGAGPACDRGPAGTDGGPRAGRAIALLQRTRAAAGRDQGADRAHQPAHRPRDARLRTTPGGGAAERRTGPAGRCTAGGAARAAAAARAARSTSRR